MAAAGLAAKGSAVNESNPTEMMALAASILGQLAEIQSTPVEKIAALRIAAFAIEQAMAAQQLAIVMSNIVKKSGS